jgi:hypothetical protein
MSSSQSLVFRNGLENKWRHVVFSVINFYESPKKATCGKNLYRVGDSTDVVRQISDKASADDVFSFKVYKIKSVVLQDPLWFFTIYI